MFEMDDDERVIAETAAAFAAKRLAPQAPRKWASKHFPIDVLREAAQLGIRRRSTATRPRRWQSGLRRPDAVRIFEQFAYADPAVASFISIHNIRARG